MVSCLEILANGGTAMIARLDKIKSYDCALRGGGFCCQGSPTFSEHPSLRVFLCLAIVATGIELTQKLSV